MKYWCNWTIMASFQHGFINIAQVIFVDFLVKMIFKTDLQIFTTLSKNKKIYVWCTAALFKKNQNRLLQEVGIKKLCPDEKTKRGVFSVREIVTINLFGFEKSIVISVLMCLDIHRDI